MIEFANSGAATAPASAPQNSQPPAEQRPAALDLDKLERQGGTPIPFDFIHEGKRYMMSDPQEVDWQDLISAMSNPHTFFRLVLPPEDRQAFFSVRMPSWKMNVLMRKYQDHYGLPDAPNAAGLPR